MVPAPGKMLEQAAVSRSSTGLTRSIGRTGNQVRAGSCRTQPAHLPTSPSCPAPWSSLLTLPLLLPAALKMFPWLPHQVSLMGVESCQRSVSHHGDFCLEPGPYVDSSAGVEGQGVRPHIVRTKNLTFSQGWEENSAAGRCRYREAIAGCRECGFWETVRIAWPGA